MMNCKQRRNIALALAVTQLASQSVYATSGSFVNSAHSKSTDEVKPFVTDLPELGRKNDDGYKESSNYVDVGNIIAGELARLGKTYGVDDEGNNPSLNFIDSEKKYLEGRVRSSFEREANENLNRIFVDYGHIESKFSLDEKFEPSLNLKALLPLYENDNSLLFVQSSINNIGKKNTRKALNFGLGYRIFNEDSSLMYGINSFYDRDLTRGHERLGVGTELWADYLKLGGNFYMPVSGWKTSSSVEDYEERPAYGVDIRANMYLPSHPEFEGQLVFEQYFGSEVGIKSDTERESNPMQATIGFGWHPIPLFTTKLEHSIRSGGSQDTNLSIGLEWRIGSTWEQMTNPALIAQQRTLVGMRHDFVERNNEIVLEYREKITPIEIHHPPVTAVSSSTVVISPDISGGEPVSFRWYSTSPMLQGQLDLTDVTEKDLHLVLPDLPLSVPEDKYDLFLEVKDKHGRTWTSDMISVTVVADAQSIKDSIRFQNGDVVKLIPGEPVEVEWVMERASGDASVSIKPDNINLSTTFTEGVTVENKSGYESADGTWINVLRITLSSNGVDNLGSPEGKLIVAATDPDFPGISAVGSENAILIGGHIDDGVEVFITGEPLNGAILTAHFECEMTCTVPLNSYLWQIETKPSSGEFEDIPNENQQQLVVKSEYQHRRIRVGLSAEASLVNPRLVAKNSTLLMQ